MNVVKIGDVIHITDSIGAQQIRCYGGSRVAFYGDEATMSFAKALDSSQVKATGDSVLRVYRAPGAISSPWPLTLDNAPTVQHDGKPYARKDAGLELARRIAEEDRTLLERLSGEVE